MSFLQMTAFSQRPLTLFVQPWYRTVVLYQLQSIKLHWTIE
jgi:hypothetical protein